MKLIHAIFALRHVLLRSMVDLKGMKMTLTFPKAEQAFGAQRALSRKINDELGPMYMEPQFGPSSWFKARLAGIDIEIEHEEKYPPGTQLAYWERPF